MRVAIFFPGEKTYHLQEWVLTDTKPLAFHLRRALRGNPQTIPPPPPLVAYGSGEIKGVAMNPFAWGVLTHVGFENTGLGGVYMGTVVVMGARDLSLTEDDVARLEEGVTRYKQELAHLTNESLS